MTSTYGSTILKGLAIVLTIISALIGAAYGWYCYTFPYGANTRASNEGSSPLPSSILHFRPLARLHLDH